MKLCLLAALAAVLLLASPASAHRNPWYGPIHRPPRHAMPFYGPPTIRVGYWVPTPHGWRWQTITVPAYVRRPHAR